MDANLKLELDRAYEHVKFLEDEISRATDFNESKKVQPRLDIAKAYASGLQRAEHYAAVAYQKGVTDAKQAKK